MGDQNQASFTGEMARTMEELSIKAQTIQMEIENDERLWNKLNDELMILKEQRFRLRVRMGKREATRKEYDKTLVEASIALKKVQDTCTALMSVLKK